MEASVPARRLILLRHAKSCWGIGHLKVFALTNYPNPKIPNLFFCIDHDRPLSKAGETDVIRVTYKLQHLGWIPQLILSSDATRTRQTLIIMQDQVQALLES